MERDIGYARAVVHGDKIVIMPGKRRYKLADLLTGITPGDMQDAFDWGHDMGRERID